MIPHSIELINALSATQFAIDLFSQVVVQALNSSSDWKKINVKRDIFW